MRLDITNRTTNDVFGIRQDRVIAGGNDTPRMHLLRFAPALRHAAHRLSEHQSTLLAYLESAMKRCWRHLKRASATLADPQSAWQSAVPVVMPSVTVGPAATRLRRKCLKRNSGN